MGRYTQEFKAEATALALKSHLSHQEGYRRIYKALVTSHDYKGSRKRVRRRMIANDFKAKQRKVFKITTDSNYDLLISLNILNRELMRQNPIRNGWIHIKQLLAQQQFISG